jgi:hypothetical protein
MAGTFAQARPRAATSAASSISSPSTIAASALRRSRSRADSAPQTVPSSAATARWRMLKRRMRPIAR